MTPIFKQNKITTKTTIYNLNDNTNFLNDFEFHTMIYSELFTNRTSELIGIKLKPIDSNIEPIKEKLFDLFNDLLYGFNKKSEIVFNIDLDFFDNDKHKKKLKFTGCFVNNIEFDEYGVLYIDVNIDYKVETLISC